MSQKIEIPKGDAGFRLNFTVTDSDGTVFNLTDYTIKFNVWKAGSPGTLLDEGTCTISVAASGTCYYTVVAGNFNTVGRYRWELQLTKSGVVESTKAADLEVKESG